MAQDPWSGQVEALGQFIHAQRKLAKLSLRELAGLSDISNPYLSQVERGLRKPSAEMLTRIAQGLRISAETLYVQAGILDQREGDEAVTTAIATDLTLSERQRATLLQIYAAFQAENRAQAEREAVDLDDEDEPTPNEPTPTGPDTPSTTTMDDREEAR